MRLALRTALTATLLTRLALIPVGLVALMILGHARDAGPPPVGSDFTSLPLKWDAPIYVGIAQDGYEWEGPGQINSPLVFFPAYPLLLRGIARVLRLPESEIAWVWAGVVLSTVLFAAALAYLQALTNLLAPERSGRLAVWLVACYPFSLFYGQAYTESLFLLAAVGACYHCYRGQLLGAFAFGCLVGLTRPTGALVAVMLAGFAWQAIARRERAGWEGMTRLAAVAASPVLGLLAYSAWVRTLTGHWFTWITDQASWGRQVTSPVEVVLALMRSIADRGLASYLFDRPYELARPYELLYLAIALTALGLAWPVARRFGWGMGAFVLLSIVLPVSAGGFISVGRFSCVLFPVFMWLSTRKWAVPLIVVFAIGEVVFAGLFYTHRHVF